MFRFHFDDESAGKEDLLGAQKAEVVVVFCDLRGFTAFSAKAEVTRSSRRSLILSRSRSACGNGVTAPMSIAMAPTESRWLAIRPSSQAITRQYSPRRGTSILASASQAIAQPWLHCIAET